VFLLDTQISTRCGLRRKREEIMKGGESSMLHIVVKYGTVVCVYKLGKTPDEPVTYLYEEFDYKVENEDQIGKKMKYKKGKDGWLIPIFPKRKKGA
jgi:hypothetical protein